MENSACIHVLSTETTGKKRVKSDEHMIKIIKKAYREKIPAFSTS
jgi:hypothetical protein